MKIKPSITRLFLIVRFACATIVSAQGLNFAGVPLRPGGTVRAPVPLSAQERSYVSEEGNAASHAVAVIAVPPGFDPAKPWPVLVPISTSDFNRKNRDDLVDFYRQSALAEGWVLLAGDGEDNPSHDTAGWRAGMTLAAIDALQRSFPGAKNWPVAVAGFSGGAKRAGTIAPLLAVAGCRVIGIYLSGLNSERLSEGYRIFHPGAAFLRTPVYIISGQLDPIATLAQQQQVKRALERTGFTRVRQVTTPGGHAVSRSGIREGLRWFRQQETVR